MPSLKIGRNQIKYDLQGDDGREVIVFINGLTQSTTFWTDYQEKLSRKGYRVLAYDLLGQGESSKPVLYIPLEDHADMLCQLLDALNIERCHVAGISFGGVVSLHAAIRHPARIQSLIAMSTFCSMPPQLEKLGTAMYEAMIQIGFPMVQKLLLPMNYSSAWLKQATPIMHDMVRRSYVTNDPYAVQNLMESFVKFNEFSAQVDKIQCPTLILNGEFDYLTPRECHEELRTRIANSRLVIFPQAYHAFTIEHPALSMRLIDGFIRCVGDGTWRGDQSVWVANEDIDSETYATRFIGDHMRAIFVGEMPSGPVEEWKIQQPGMPAKTPVKKTPPAKAARKRSRAASPE